MKGILIIFGAFLAVIAALALLVEILIKIDEKNRSK